jgi:hypothetical protein
VLLCNEASRGPSLREIREVPPLRYVFAVSESDELTNYSNQVTQAQRSIHTDIGRNRRQYSEIRDSESRKNIGLRRVGEAVAEREESHRPLIRIVQSTSLKPDDLQRGCPLNNLSPRDVAPRCGYSASGRRLSFLASVPTGGDHVDEIHKTQEKWNGAGTFGSLVTLKKHERCEKRRRRIARIELTH